MKKNGFVATSLIYTFFIIFLTLLLFLLNSYSRTRNILNEYKYEIRNDLYEREKDEVTLNYMVWNDDTSEYEYSDSFPSDYEYQSDLSHCNNGGSISFVDGEVKIDAVGKTECFAYFKRNEEV